DAVCGVVTLCWGRSVPRSDGRLACRPQSLGHQEKPMAKAVDYWTLIEPIWLPLNHSWDDPEKFIRKYRRVPPAAGHLYAAHWCQSEVRNGGFHQFFSNTTGLLAPEALEGFRAIGMTAWAEILAEAMKHFGKTYPRGRDNREESLPIRQRGPR